ncbi:IPT/TIG domain-containing protein [Actinomadura sp. K4S16]|uniref:IPT/TIG domain-containing protein n=1 Tax=Actinomadura sp. K4S16 TaxID=1316147 RepID=UPI0011EC25F5|nr:IPT/TIG domain-containing protein [Actinomadura sp. K4S16]
MAPVITSLSCGPQGTNQGNAGQTLTITGTGLGALGSTPTVKFGSTSRTGTVTVADTTVTVIVPSGSGTVVVVVVVGGVTSNSRPFYYIPPPSLCSISPAEGPGTPAPEITLLGNNLLTANQATFNGTDNETAAAAVDYAATATPTNIAPLGVSPYFQSVSVALRTAGGSTTLNGDYLAYDAPTIGTVAPSSGDAGTEVLITGTGYVGPSITVTFGGVEAAATALSETQITATAPPGLTGAQDVVVTTLGGSDTEVDGFTYPA